MSQKIMANMHVVTDTVEKNPQVLVIPKLGSISLQTRTKLKKSLKNILNCCKLQIVFKNKTRLGNKFHFKDRIPKDLTSGVAYKFHCGLCNESYYGECVGHFNVRTIEHLVYTTYQKISSADHLPFCNHSAFYDDFSIIMGENKYFLLEVLVVRSLLEYYLLLIVATLFLLNGLFIILS